MPDTKPEAHSPSECAAKEPLYLLTGTPERPAPVCTCSYGMCVHHGVFKSPQEPETR